MGTRTCTRACSQLHTSILMFTLFCKIHYQIDNDSFIDTRNKFICYNLSSIFTTHPEEIKSMKFDLKYFTKSIVDSVIQEREIHQPFQMSNTVNIVYLILQEFCNTRFIVYITQEPPPIAISQSKEDSIEVCR